VSALAQIERLRLEELVDAVEDLEQTALGHLFGRERETARIEAFATSAGRGGGTLLLLGEAGIGKTVLLDAAATFAATAGIRVLRAAGVEFEADLPFSGLHQLLLPLHAELSQLDPPYRQTLNAALGFSEGVAVDRLLVGNATLALLALSAAARPLLMVVDDLHWLDRTSNGVLAFVARRLAGIRVSFLGASRTGEGGFFESAGLLEIELEPLKERAASDLLSAHSPTLPPDLHRRVLQAARGVPLALLELPATLTASSLEYAAGRPVLVPITRRLTALFASRVRKLSATGRTLLLLAAMDGTGDIRILRALGNDSDGPEALAAAERARLMCVDPSSRRLAFHHPLIRSTVVELSTAEERRRAHKQLADVFAEQPDRRAWHLAEAALGPDEQVAGLLEDLAHRILPRGDTVGAVTALVRASELSPETGEKSRRLAQAAFIAADVRSDLQGASQPLADARTVDREQQPSLTAAVTPSHLLWEPFDAALWRVVGDGRDGTALACGLNAQILLGRECWSTGQWTQARKLVDDAVDRCLANGYVLLAWAGRHVQALLAAARGEYEIAEQAAESMIQWSAARGVGLVQAYAWQIRTLTALGSGDFDQAYRQASKISPPGTLAAHTPCALLVQLDLVEAAVRTGRHAQAAAHVAAARGTAVGKLSARLALLAGASAALVAPDDAAPRLFAEALATPGIDRWPFDLARVQLLYGERLRRTRAIKESRVHLGAALETFRRLGTQPWVQRAANELRATGETKPRHHDRDRDTLTPQENKIAQLAASGLTNKQIGERLFLSPRTVGFHLHRVFPKLGIRSRAALRDALVALPADSR
jgi:DNA-binding CsgD family transcriptional regulator